MPNDQRAGMTEIEVHPGDVVALVAPDGTRWRYMCSTLHDNRYSPNPRYQLSDHIEDNSNATYDRMLDERTTIVLRWVDD